MTRGAERSRLLAALDDEIAGCCDEQDGEPGSLLATLRAARAALAADGFSRFGCKLCGTTTATGVCLPCYQRAKVDRGRRPRG